MRLTTSFTVQNDQPTQPRRPGQPHASEQMPAPLLATVAPQELEALLWLSRRPNYPSAWHGFVAFAHWLVQAARPRVVVELGTHCGVSYASFCHAVAALNLPSRCFAIDTWLGDAQTGVYGEDVYSDLKSFNDRYYGRFSTLLRSTFDAALGRFGNGTIDLLHIDGEHTYEAVRHDFETWFPKLSDRAVVLLHDTAVREPGFGVWRMWEGLIRRYPSFSFEHSFGLGVLAVGASPPPPVAALCALTSATEIARVRAYVASFSDLAQSNALRQMELGQLRERLSEAPLFQPTRP